MQARTCSQFLIIARSPGHALIRRRLPVSHVSSPKHASEMQHHAALPPKPLYCQEGLVVHLRLEVVHRVATVSILREKSQFLCENGQCYTSTARVRLQVGCVLMVKGVHEEHYQTKLTCCNGFAPAFSSASTVRCRESTSSGCCSRSCWRSLLCSALFSCAAYLDLKSISAGMPFSGTYSAAPYLHSAFTSSSTMDVTIFSLYS